MAPTSSRGSETEALGNEDAMRWQKARQQITTGRGAEALPAYQALVKRLPRIPNLWFEFGLAAVGALDFPLARRAFLQARELAPAEADMLLALGQQYHRLRQPEVARACFAEAARANPTSVHANLSQAAWLEREHQLDAAWQCVEETVTRHPEDASAQYYRAFLLQRLGRAGEAETALRALVQKESLEANLRISCLHLLAVVLDELGQYDEALRWLRDSKDAARRAANIPALEQSYDKSDRARRQLLAGLTPDMRRRWREETPTSAVPQRLALLGGHPRSGTTLLEQVLGAHPEVLAFDEAEAFATEIWDQLAPAQGASMDARGLNELPPSRRSILRGRYFKSLFREWDAPPAGKVLLDKNPATTAALHFWLRFFPASKVIIALRDPRDVVLSCFFQQLALTPMNVNFLSIERAAKHYSDLMDVWLRLRDLGGFDWLETRYETLVADVAGEGRRVTEFLGLTWHPAQAQWQEGARRKVVFSPTYDDVTKPAHSRAVGRWKHYAEALAPAQERLAPYCKIFGY